MGKFLRGLLVLAIVFFVGVTTVQAGDYNYWVRVLDTEGDEITTGLRAYICDNGTLTASTVYSDANRTALTNTSMQTTTGPNDSGDGGFDPGTDAVIKWWGPNTSYSLYITDGYYWDIFDGIAVTDHAVTFVGREIRANDGSFDDSSPGRIVVIGLGANAEIFVCTGTTTWIDISD